MQHSLLTKTRIMQPGHQSPPPPSPAAPAEPSPAPTAAPPPRAPAPGGQGHRPRPGDWRTQHAVTHHVGRAERRGFEATQLLNRAFLF